MAPDARIVYVAGDRSASLASSIDPLETIVDDHQADIVSDSWPHRSSPASRPTPSRAQGVPIGFTNPAIYARSHHPRPGLRLLVARTALRPQHGGGSLPRAEVQERRG